MKKICTLLIVCVSVVFAVPAVYAGEKGASEKAQEHASDQAVFNRVGDWFATVGKSGEEKEQILTERKAQRASKRAEKEAKKKAKQAEKEARKAEKATGKKAKEAKGKAGKALDDMGKKLKGKK